MGFPLISDVFGWSLLPPNRKEITKNVSWEDSFFLGSQEDIDVYLFVHTKVTFISPQRGGTRLHQSKRDKQYKIKQSLNNIFKF